MILQQRDKEEDMTFLNRLFSNDPNSSLHADIRAVCFVDLCMDGTGTVLSLVTASVGFTMEGFLP